MPNEITSKAILELDFFEAKKCVLDLAGGNIKIAGQNSLINTYVQLYDQEEHAGIYLDLST